MVDCLTAAAELLDCLTGAAARLVDCLTGAPADSPNSSLRSELMPRILMSSSHEPYKISFLTKRYSLGVPVVFCRSCGLVQTPAV